MINLFTTESNVTLRVTTVTGVVTLVPPLADDGCFKVYSHPEAIIIREIGGWYDAFECFRQLEFPLGTVVVAVVD